MGNKRKKGKKGKLKPSGFASESFSGLIYHRERMRKGGRGAAKGKRVKEKRLIGLAEAEANEVVAIGGIDVEAKGAAQDHGPVGPTAAAQHAVGAGAGAWWILFGSTFIIIGTIPITAPFPDVSSHIQKTIGRSTCRI